MVPTSDERREVAERLRRAADSDEWLDVTINDAIFGVFGEVRRPIADTLADLIDPTCHVVIPNEMDGECFCSECGALLGEYGYTAYCPCCGARVKSGGER